MEPKNLLPINAFYMTWLRDNGCINRPDAVRKNKKTDEIVSRKDRMDSIDMLIYIMLLSRADNKTLTCYPSINTIADDCGGLDRRVVWAHLQDLEQMEFITIKKQKGKPNTYYMLDFARWKENPRY